MVNFPIDLKDFKDLPGDVIASELRRQANSYSIKQPVLSAITWAFIGASLVASLDYGDVHICVGACQDVAGGGAE